MAKNANKNPSNKELLELNKSTLRFMIHKLKGRIVREPVLNEPINDRLEPQSISYQSNYDSLQNDYNNMHKRNIPQEPDFKEPLDNEKIQNMEELLQQQLKDRALEMPKPPIQSASKSANPVLAQAEIKDMSVQTENIDEDELKNQIETLLHRTDALEREINVMRTQLTKPTIIHQSNNEETLSL